MSTLSCWFGIVRSILEVLYFLAGIVIAVAAILALRQVNIALEQLKITKQIANNNAKREAIKLAVEQCRYYAEHAVPLVASVGLEYNRRGLTFLSVKPQFVVQNGEILNPNFDTKVLDAEVPGFMITLVNLLNTTEAFAIPFAAGVADDDLGYQETAIAFCQAVQIYMPAFFQMRRTNAGRFESTIKLYERWNKRLAAQAVAPLMASLEELIKDAKAQRIKPLGTED